MACNTTNKLNVDMETLRHGTKVLRDQKDFRSTHIDYISTDLDYKYFAKG